MEHDDQKPNFEGWAVVEQMGHNRYAGRISELVLGGASLIRLDVPEIPERVEKYRDWDYGGGVSKAVMKQRTIPARQAYTKFIGPSSIFAITPCTEEVARAAAEQIREDPISCVTLPEPLQIAAAEPDDDESDTGEDESDHPPDPVDIPY